MSCVVVLAPVVAATAWPAMVSAATAVMVAMGFTAVEVGLTARNRVGVDETVREKEGIEIKLTNAEEVGASVGRGSELVFTRDEVEVTFSRDIRGRLKVHVSDGGIRSRAELEALGRELGGRGVQQYVYNRVVEEMKNRTGMELVEQEVDEENNIRIKLRSWED